MVKLAVAEAKDRFGQLVDHVHQEPMTIEKNGRPVAVVISIEAYQQGEQLKAETLQRDLDIGIAQADKGELLQSDQVFTELLTD